MYVLVVDDYPDAAEMIAAYLRYHGAHVQTAHSGGEALVCLATARANVLVLDYEMPGMTGFELLALVRKMPGEAEHPTPAALCTARDDLASEARAAGFAAYLVKPLDPRTLVAEVARLAGV